MKKINCLYMEDTDTDFKLLSDTLKLTLRNEVELDIVRAHDPIQACEMLDRYGDSYQLFIADLMFPDNENHLKLDGLIAVEKAQSFSSLAITALSVAERTNSEVRHLFDEATGNTGLYLDKDAVRQRRYPKEKLRRDLLKLLESKNHLSYSNEDLDNYLPWQKGQQLKLDALIETVGHETLVSLIRDAAPECEHYQVYYVAPGYSGAVVLRVIGSKHGSTAQDTNILLKCSRDRSKLEVEIQQCPQPKEPASIIYVLPDSTSIHQRNGWFASAWTFRDDAQTFLSWLRAGEIIEGRIEDALTSLFLSGLNKDYVRGRRTEEKSSVISLYPNVIGRYRIAESAKLLQLLIQQASVDAVFEIAEIERFLVDELLCGRPISKVALGTYECLCHGDLHSRNILITNRHQPLLIDPARRKVRHWASDVARLCADLWISAWDSGPRSYKWDHLDTWREDVFSWIVSTDVSVTRRDGINNGPARSLTWLKENLTRVFAECEIGELPVWEFRLALAVEFLNLSGYETVPAPKRCLALLSANDILESLKHEEGIPWLT